MTGPAGPDAALEQGTRNAERIAHHDAALASLAATLAELGATVDAIQGTITGQDDVLRTVDGLKDTVDELLCRVGALFPGGDTGGAFYKPIPAPAYRSVTEAIPAGTLPADDLVLEPAGPGGDYPWSAS